MISLGTFTRLSSTHQWKQQLSQDNLRFSIMSRGCNYNLVNCAYTSVTHDFSLLSSALILTNTYQIESVPAQSWWKVGGAISELVEPPLVTRVDLSISMGKPAFCDFIIAYSSLWQRLMTSQVYLHTSKVRCALTLQIKPHDSSTSPLINQMNSAQ